MLRMLKSRAELQEICLKRLKTCAGFEPVTEIIVVPREPLTGGANWSVASIRPRVDNGVLRGARETIDQLQQSYQLCEVATRGDDGSMPERNGGRGRVRNDGRRMSLQSRADTMAPAVQISSPSAGRHSGRPIR